jgi:hypothetical protein
LPSGDEAACTFCPPSAVIWISRPSGGSQKFRNIPVALTASEPTEEIGDGLLPMALFQVLYINNREGFVVFHLQARKE